jgi:hypothetical protein
MMSQTPIEYKKLTQAEKEHQEACDKAADIGADYAEWDYDQLTQSAEYANDILPALRELAGFVDYYGGTYTQYPDNATEAQKDEIEADFEEIMDAFEEGYWDNHVDNDESEDDD